MDREIAKYLRQIEDGLARAQEGVRNLRALADPAAAGSKPWDRMMLSVLAELDRRGGRVQRSVLADIGESYGYDRHGLGGFYQGLVRRDGSYAELTDAGRERLEMLRERFEELPPAA